MSIVLFECCIIYSVLSMTQIVTPDITRSIPIKVPVDRTKFSSRQNNISIIILLVYIRDHQGFGFFLHLITFHFSHNFKETIVVIRLSRWWCENQLPLMKTLMKFLWYYTFSTFARSDNKTKLPIMLMWLEHFGKYDQRATYLY